MRVELSWGISGLRDIVNSHVIKTRAHVAQVPWIYTRPSSRRRPMLSWPADCPPAELVRAETHEWPA